MPSPLEALAPSPAEEHLGPGSRVLRGFATAEADSLLEALEGLVERAPFRNMETPGKSLMSVAMTNCGELGWVSGRTGIRYERQDPLTGNAWPGIPDAFLRVAVSAAKRGGFEDFVPDACLVNRYQIGARLTLHQDRDERDLWQPIVSVSLGMPAVFLFGGETREEPVREVPVTHGDVVVWGGPDRLRYHGVLPLKPARGLALGGLRYNLTFRKAG
jgi:alkylated DNA repair protein (DNA oxidative demethylase)